MQEVQVYTQIPEAQSIISQLVENLYHEDEYQEYLKELEETGSKKLVSINKTFADIRVFGSSANPLFMASAVGIILGASNVNSMIKNYTDTEKVVGYVKDKGKITKKIFLTKNGIYRLIFNNKTKFSELFRGFIYKLIDHMLNHEVEKLQSIIKEYTRENRGLVTESMEELDANIRKYKELYDAEKAERIDLETELSFNEMYIEQLKSEKKNIMRKLDGRNEDDNLNETSKALDIIKKRFLKPFTISMVNPIVLEKLFSSDGSTLYDISNEEYTYLSYKNNYNFITKMVNKGSIISVEEVFYISLSYNKEASTPAPKEIKPKKNTKSPKNMKSSKDCSDSDNDSSSEKSNPENTVVKFFPVTSDYCFDKNQFLELIETLKSECDYYQIKKNSSASSNYIFKATIDHIKTITRDLILGNAE